MPISEMLFARLIGKKLPEDQLIEEATRLFGKIIAQELFDNRAAIMRVMANEPYLRT
jgi:hypothetical protein